MGAAALHSGIFERRRKPEVGLSEDGHIAGENADNGANLAVESDRFPNNVRIAAETFLPQMMAENYNLRIRSFFVGKSEHTAIARLNAKSVEETCRYHGTRDLNGLVGSGEIEKRISHRPGAVMFKGVALRALVHKVRRRNSTVLTERTLAPAPH